MALFCPNKLPRSVSLSGMVFLYSWAGPFWTPESCDLSKPFNNIESYLDIDKEFVEYFPCSRPYINYKNVTTLKFVGRVSPILHINPTYPSFSIKSATCSL